MSNDLDVGRGCFDDGPLFRLRQRGRAPAPQVSGPLRYALSQPRLQASADGQASAARARGRRAAAPGLARVGRLKERAAQLGTEGVSVGHRHTSYTRRRGCCPCCNSAYGTAIGYCHDLVVCAKCCWNCKGARPTGAA